MTLLILFPNSIKPFSQPNFLMQASGPPSITGLLGSIFAFKMERNVQNTIFFRSIITSSCSGYESSTGLSMSSGAPPWHGRSISGSQLRMLEFSAFLEHPQDPETVSQATGLMLFLTELMHHSHIFTCRSTNICSYTSVRPTPHTATRS